MGFLELVNKRLDHVKAYNSERHYTDHIYMARRWIKEWKGFACSEFTTDMIQDFLLKRLRETSPFTANKELRYLRSLFNYGLHPVRNWITHNPTRGIEFFPVDKQIKYVPPNEDVLRVILAADPDKQDYLWTIALTMGRMSEVNRLTWQDVNFKERYVVLYTRKKKGGHRTPRKIPMTDKLFDVLSRRYASRDKRKPWVFWHRYWSRKIDGWTTGPFKERKKIMRTLCKRAGVRYFRYHALRHFGASLLEQENVPIGSIQRLLGHEHRSTTELYLHSIGESEREAMDVLNARFESFSHTDSHTEKKDPQAAPCKSLK
jgi:integrase